MNSSNSDRHTIRIGRILRDVKTVSSRESSAPAQRAMPMFAEASRTPDAPDSTDLQEAGQDEDAYRRGVKDGRRQVLEELGGAAALLREAANAIQNQSRELTRSMDEQVVALSMAVARKIIARELEQPDTVRDMLLRALAELPAGGPMRVMMNPADLQLLEENKARIQSTGQSLPEDLVLCPDASVMRGGCLIESPGGNVDARMETQLTVIEEALRGVDPHGAHDDATAAGA